MSKTALVIPCYNEAARLDADQYRVFLGAYPDANLIFVDDGSSDDTAGALGRIAGANPGRVTVLRLPRNGGKAQAVRAGVLEAFAGDYEFAGYWDADNATPLRLLGSLLGELERGGVHMALGSRVNLLGKRIHRSSLRHYLGRVFASMASVILGLHIYDTQCGSKVFRSTPLMRRVFAEPFVTGWTFDLEIIARTIIFARESEPGLAPERLMVELPLDEWVDVPGSKLKASHVFRIGRDMLKIYALYHGKI